MAPTATDYADIQQNEIDALSAIFMEDFEEQKNKVGAWNKAADRGFTLHLKSSLSTVPDLGVKLSVTFPVTYPKTAPQFHVKFGNAVRTKPTRRIQGVIDLTPPKLLGTEMVFAIATEIQDILDDASQELLRETPNLDQERAIHQASTQNLAEQADNQRRRRESDAIAERNATRQEHIVSLDNYQGDQDHHSEMVRKITKHGETKGPDVDYVEFEQPTDVAGLESFKGIITPFRKVFHRVPFGRGPVTKIYTVLPEDSLDVPTNFMILKECAVKMITGDEGQDSEETRKKQDVQKRAIQDLESMLTELMRSPKNEHIANVRNFRVQSMLSDETGLMSGWNVSILVERASRGSLQELMESMKTLDIKVAKPWVLDIAAGIKWLHQHGLIHGRLHPRNVLFASQSGRPMKVKLYDGHFQDYLYKIGSSSRTDYNMARSTFWMASEALDSPDPRLQKATDIWDFGVLMLQMLFGLDVEKDYSSPDAVFSAMSLSYSFHDLMSKIFKADFKKRLNAFNLTMHQFFVLENPVYGLQDGHDHLDPTNLSSFKAERRLLGSRGESKIAVHGPSRYAQDFEQEMILGKGGFGAVYMARHRLENRIYAIKKIVQSSASALEPILKEVQFLSQLNHPNVVRYFTAWIEGNSSGPKVPVLSSEDGKESLEDEFGSSSQEPDTSGLDFISSSGRVDIDFGYDDDDEMESASPSAEVDVHFGYDDDNGTANEPGGQSTYQPRTGEEDVSASDVSSSAASLPRLRRWSTAQSPGKTTLYIQMEYCKNKTLRDLILQDLHLQMQDCWRLFRQILDGLAHIHSHGIIHRDLKPENIFIDMSNNAKIGDYGLAAPVEFQPIHHSAIAAFATNANLTQSIGTAVYVAPEVKSAGGGNYNEKADMYSLGIVFFEMCYPLKTAMERAVTLGDLQKADHTLPAIFQQPDKLLQGQIIELLVAINPIERPSGPELLQSGKLPVEMVDQTIRAAIQCVSDINDPNHKTLMAALFSGTTEEISRELSYKLPSIGQTEHNDLLCSLVKEQLVTVFRRHGAVEVEVPLLLPTSSLYDDTIVTLLDASGTLLQLPYDLTFPTARVLATQTVSTRKTYTFGNVYRNTRLTGHPPYFKEVAFNILSPDSLDLGLRQAEVIKVMDEVLDAFPNLATARVYYHVNHSRILDHVLDFCEVERAKWRKVKDVLSKLDNLQWTWGGIRTLLRSPDVGVPATSLDSLEHFNFRGTHEETVAKLRALLPNSAELETTFSHLQAILKYLASFQVKRPIYIDILSCVNEKFYEKNFMFQCVMESKKRKDVVAVGGRIDELILNQHQGPHRDQVQHATGFSLGWGSIITMMARYQKKAGHSTQKGREGDQEGVWAIRRCDVLVNSFEEDSLRDTGLSILNDLWANGISAELVIDTTEGEQFHHRHASNKLGSCQHGWIASVKQDGSVKVRNILKKEEADLRVQDVPNFLRNEIQERDRTEAKSVERLKLSKNTSHFNPGASGPHDRDSNVIVITSQSKGKKTNRQAVISDAQLYTHDLVQGFGDAPVVAIETSKDTFDGIRDTRLADESSWKALIQKSPVSDRQYLADVQAQLKDIAKNTKSDRRSAFIYNFRAKSCILYDFGKAA